MSEWYVLGVDVGSAEARCGLVDSGGRVLSMATSRISIHNPLPGYYQQSSKEIWQAVVQVIKKVTEGVDVNKVRGIGCDATCSLVVVGDHGEAVTVSPQGEEDENVIMWMDHRAGEQADRINLTGHELLSYLGGKVSLEMQMPKLLWLKENLATSFQQARHFFDLPDFLTWKLTDSDTRSQCSLVCKWMYEGSPLSTVPGWNQKFLTDIGLQLLCQDNCRRIGCKVAMPGELVGLLTNQAAKETGLRPGVPVAASLIDAHAGALGLLATDIPRHLPVANRLGMICGTSNCFMLLSPRGVSVEGVWGPYYGAVLDRWWLSEGGQSAAGQLVAHLVATHPAWPGSTNPSEVCPALARTLQDMAAAQHCSLQTLTRNFHLYPDFRGNRSPLANPNMRGMVSGLDLSTSLDQLGLVYLSALQALSYGARQTVEKLEGKGLGPIECLSLCGGLAKNKLFVQTLAGALGRTVVVPKTEEAVLLGSAMLGAAAASMYPSLEECMSAMASQGDLVQEPDPEILRFHNAKYQVYLKMQSDQIAYQNIMSHFK